MTAANEGLKQMVMERSMILGQVRAIRLFFNIIVHVKNKFPDKSGMSWVELRALFESMDVSKSVVDPDIDLSSLDGAK